MALPLPRPQLPEHLLQMIRHISEEFEHRAGAFAPVLRASGHSDFLNEQLDKLARAGYECGLVEQTERRLHAFSAPPPKGAT